MPWPLELPTLLCYDVGCRCRQLHELPIGLGLDHAVIGGMWCSSWQSKTVNPTLPQYTQL